MKQILPALSLLAALGLAVPACPPAFAAAPAAPKASAPSAKAAAERIRSVPDAPAQEDDVVPVGTPLTAPPAEDDDTPEAAAESGTEEAESKPDPERERRRAAAEKARAAQEGGDFAAALSLWESLAKDGDARAMNRLGVMHESGLGVEPDVGRAVHWYARAASAGNPSGMANYGRMLQEGRGIPADSAEAARWFDLAARQGQREAQYNLGLLYEHGVGVRKDPAAAAAWYTRAAAQDQPDALARLGRFFRTGTGVGKNLSRATLMYFGAVMQGNADAMRALAEMAAESPPREPAVLFGQRLDGAERDGFRKALRTAGLRAIREEDGFPCDVYDTAGKVPGAAQLAACFGPGRKGGSAPLAFVKIDYPASGPDFARRLNSMMTQRFGPVSANEGGSACLWNLGDVIVATQYAPDHRQIGLMYMIPRIYHLTQGR